MPQTDIGTKAYFDGSRETRGPIDEGTGQPVGEEAMTDTQLDDVYDWLGDHISKPGRATADDLANYFHQHLGEQVLSHKRGRNVPTWV